ncbi:MAG TPA: universal stress protein [Pseudonocardiaceae bacterium]|nr:universal stress protein [Pseudonocardiaceae bacterium]
MAAQTSGNSGFEIGKDGVGSIVVGYDGSPPSTHAAAWAAGLARRERGVLLIVYVEVLSSPAYWTALGTAAAAEAGVEFMQQLRDEAGPLLDERGVTWEMLYGQGEPATVLESIAEERRADCIVVGRSRHRGGLLGTVPKSLIAHATRPVVIVP